MRGKRSKQYRKLMQQYGLTFGFREPYQVVVDAQMLLDVNRFTMDLPAMLSRTLHGDVKPMITNCSIRHLLALPVGPPPSSTPDKKSSSSSSSTGPSLSDPVSSVTKTAILTLSRSLTLRRCNHHTLPEPLSPLECLSSVLDPGQSGSNKHHLVLAVQDKDVRRWARAEVRGVPTIYVKRSVMIMEPMSEASERVKQGLERDKIKGDRKAGPTKKKRQRESDDEASEADADDVPQDAVRNNKPKAKGPKQPNPLSMRKKKARKTEADAGDRATQPAKPSAPGQEAATDLSESAGKRKRRRKHGKSGEAGKDIAMTDGTVEMAV